MDKKGEKKVFYIIACFALVSIFLISFASAGWFDWFKETITGKATTSTLNLNITVGTPTIPIVINWSAANFINEGPSKSYLVINFTVYSPAGAGYVNSSTARVNLSRTGEATRTNSSCQRAANNSNYVNFTCNVTMFWYDGNGTWNIGAYAEDNNSNDASNITQTQAVGSNPALTSGPSTLTWTGIASGSKNQTANNDPLEINNTGNVVMANITINSTDLRGETNSEIGLWADNFTVSYQTGGSPPFECNGTAMSDTVVETYTQLEIVNLTKGNYTLNNGNTGQEELYFCLKIAGTELTTQAYSTRNESAWIIKGTV